MKIIGIDPDVDRSGIAILDTLTRSVMVCTLSFPELVDWLYDEANKEYAPVIVVEAGYLNRSHWHGNQQGSNRYAAAIGNDTGRNHEIAKKIVELANHKGYDVVEKKPLRKIWKGKDRKITHEEIVRICPLLKAARTNQEERDALLLALDYSGLPMQLGHWG